MKLSIIFLALIVLISGCAGFPAGTEVSDNNFSLPTIIPPTTEALSGGVGGSEPAQATTATSITATSNSCPVPHGAGNYAGGLCGVVSCDSGYYNCDGNNVNGCEATSSCATTTTSPASTTTTLANATTTSAGATTTAAATTTSGATTTTAAATTTTAAATTTTAAATTTTAAPTTTTTTVPPTTTTTSPTTTTAASKPDMTTTYTSEVHSGPAPTYTTVFFRVNNIGTVSSGGNSWAHVAAVKTGQTTETCDYAMSSINAGSYSDGNCGFVLAAGTWAITITADYTSLIDESNESNNAGATLITLS